MHDFKGKWITATEFADATAVNVFHRQLDVKEIVSKLPKDSHVLFRKKFLAEVGKKTLIYITADDYYKLYINGKFVQMGPGPGYHFHYYYNVIDITDYIEEENVIAVHTFYNGHLCRERVSNDDRHGLILDVEQDGKNILASDTDFLYDFHKGFEPLASLGYDINTNEKYISSASQVGFEKNDFDDSTWKNAAIRKNTDYELFEQPTKMLVFEDISPIDIKEDENGIQIDFGKTYVGYFYAEAEGKKNSEIEIYSAQELNDDGTVRWKLRADCNYLDIWQLSGNHDTYSQFEYKSFRYVYITKPDGCKISNIKLISRHYPFELKAKPNTDDPDLLKIWDLCVNSFKYGVQETIQDCMEREKANYLGDGCYTSIAYMILTHDDSVFKKMINDTMRTRFINKGLMTCSVSTVMQEIAEYPLMMYAAFLNYYAFTGDKTFIEKHYNQLCEVLDYYRDSYSIENGLLQNLDKWCVVEWPEEYRDGYDANLKEGRLNTDLHSVINAHYIGAILNMNKICKLLGKPDYADPTPIINAYYDTFYVPEKKLFKDNAKSEHISVVSNVFPFMYNFYRDKADDASAMEFIKEKGFCSVMLFGSFPILWGLKSRGKMDKVIECIKDEGAWKRMLREGATTTFEGWGKDAKDNASLFHLLMSYVCMYLTDWEKFKID